MVMCKKCGNKVPSSELKLDLDLKMMVCRDCVKNKGIHKEIEKEAYHREEAKPQIEEEKSSKIRHKCTSCGYKFSIDPETSKPKNCPYCNARVMGY